MAGALTTTNNTANAILVRNATSAALPSITTGSTGTTPIGVGDISGAVTQAGGTAINTGTLSGNTTGAVLLTNANTIPALGAFTSASFALTNTLPIVNTGALNMSGNASFDAG